MTSTKDIQLVSSYTGLNFIESLGLDCLTYRIYLRDAFVSKMSATEDGRKYLEDAWILTQDKPDRKKLREKFGGETI